MPSEEPRAVVLGQRVAMRMIGAMHYQCAPCGGASHALGVDLHMRWNARNVFGVDLPCGRSLTFAVDITAVGVSDVGASDFAQPVVAHNGGHH